MMMPSSFALLACVLVLLRYCTTVSVNAAASAFSHPKLHWVPDGGVGIEGQYIVTLSKDANETAVRRKVRRWRLQQPGGSLLLDFFYEKVFHGMSISNVSDSQLQAALKDPDVVRVEQDQVATADVLAVQQSPSNWGLDRIDNFNLPMDGKYSYQYNGSGVEVYIFDSGIRSNQTDFTGRVTCAKNYITTEDCQDYYFHGTHVSGIVGGVKYGVAKAVKLIAVKVLNNQGNGAFSNVIAGLDWVAGQKASKKSVPMVVNLSLGGGVSASVNSAVNSCVGAGVVVVVSAGNDNNLSCNKSPASAESAITVASTDNTDTRSPFSNYGSCVDIFAPGSNIVSASYSANTGSLAASGTSMASPFVAGVVAQYLHYNPTLSPNQTWSFIKVQSALNAVIDVVGSPNVLVNIQRLNKLAPPSPTKRPSRHPTRKPIKPTPHVPTRHPSKIPSRSPSSSPAPTKTPCKFFLQSCTVNSECCSGFCLTKQRKCSLLWRKSPN